MILFINDIKTIGDLQDKFSLCFQGLKIEFFRTIYKEDELPFKEPHISAGHQIGEIRKKHNNGFLELKSWFTISKAEQEFQDHFGLNVQIFYLKDELWVEALPGGALTLERLNKMGRNQSQSKSVSFAHNF
jgi:hypothetical protein